MNEISKILLLVTDNGEDFYVMSKKYAPNREKDGKYEFPGGHVDKGESPFEALLREVDEEIESDFLNEKLKTADLDPIQIITTSKGTHHLFRLNISREEYARLIPKEESRGFDLIPKSKLFDNLFQDSLTPKTRKIVDALK